MAAMVERLRLGPRRGMLVAAFVVALLVGFVLWQSWAGYKVTGDTIVAFVVTGIVLGSIYAVAATGLVVTYTTSGVFNFAQGAIGTLMAFVYWQLHDGSPIEPHGWGLQTLLALLLTVLVAAPLFGAFIEWAFMRRVADVSLVAQLVTTIGLTFGLIGLIGLIWDQSQSHVVRQFFFLKGFHIGGTNVLWSRFITIVSGLGIALGLRLLLVRTRLGVAMRAVVDNRNLAALNGVRPGRVSMFAWMLGSSMAAIAGIFLAEELGNLNLQTLSLLVFDAFAAAIIGRLRSLPLTFLGGILIGFVISTQETFLNWGGRWSDAVQIIPMAMLFVALLFVPQARIEGRRALRTIAARVPSIKRASFGMGVLVVVMVVLGGVLERTDTRSLIVAVLTMVIMLSLVPLTGWSGQISLAQITFVGVGAYVFAENRLFLHWGGPHLGTIGGMLFAAAVAVPFGLLMALPAIRLHGLYLALASISFAAMAERVIFEQPEVFGTQGKHSGPIKILGWDSGKPFDVFGVHFGQDVGLLFVSVFLFVFVGMIVLMLRRGRLGRRLVALGDSEAACATIGVNIIATKLQVFAISAAIAGFAGSVLGVVYGVPDVNVFTMFFGLPYLLLAVVGGIATVSGAFLGGAFLQTFTYLNDKFPAAAIFGWKFLNWQSKLGPGLVGIGIGRNPSGVIPTVGEDFRHKQAIKKAKRAGLPPPDEVEPPLPEIPAPETRPVPVEAAARAGTGAGDSGAVERSSPDQGA